MFKLFFILAAVTISVQSIKFDHEAAKQYFSIPLGGSTATGSGGCSGGGSGGNTATTTVAPVAGGGGGPLPPPPAPTCDVETYCASATADAEITDETKCTATSAGCVAAKAAGGTKTCSCMEPTTTTTAAPAGGSSSSTATGTVLSITPLFQVFTQVSSGGSNSSSSGMSG